MLAVLTQRLGIKIFARQHSGIQHWALWECERPVHCSLCCKISTQPHLNAPTPPTLLTLTGSAQTNVQHAWLHVCSFTHTHTHMQQGEWNAKWATWWKDISTQTGFAYAGRGPFIQRDNVCVDFSLSAHFKHQKHQKELRGGDGGGESQCGMQS